MRRFALLLRLSLWGKHDDHASRERLFVTFLFAETARLTDRPRQPRNTAPLIQFYFLFNSNSSSGTDAGHIDYTDTSISITFWFLSVCLFRRHVFSTRDCDGCLWQTRLQLWNKQKDAMAASLTQRLERTIIYACPSAVNLTWRIPLSPLSLGQAAERACRLPGLQRRAFHQIPLKQHGHGALSRVTEYPFLRGAFTHSGEDG